MLLSICFSECITWNGVGQDGWVGIFQIYRSGGNWWKQEDLLIRGYYIGNSILGNTGTRLEKWSRHRIECQANGMLMVLILCYYMVISRKAAKHQRTQNML